MGLMVVEASNACMQRLVAFLSLKICIIAPYNVLSLASGASVRVFKIAKGLNTCGASVFVLHHGPSASLNSELKFVNFKSLSPTQRSDNYFHPLNPFYLFRLSRFLKKNDPDIVQGEQPWSVFPTLLFMKSCRIPFVLDEHNVELFWSMHSSKIPVLTPYAFIMERFAISNSSLILTVSDTDKERLSQIYQVPQERFFVVPNGVEFSRFDNTPSATALKNRLGFEQKSKIAVFHGLLSARQNEEAAEIIIDYIAPKIKDTKFLIIGKSLKSRIRTEASSRENVLILGYVPRVEEYIMAADVCVVPILRGSGTRLKLLEYSAAQKPIVATCKAVEGLSFVNKVHALLFKDVDEDFIGAINRILSDDTLAEELGSNAKQLALKFDWKKVGSRLYERYTSLLSEGKR